MKRVVSLICLVLLANLSPAAVKDHPIDYKFDGVTLKGHLFYDDAVKGPLPGVVVVHEWWGLDEYAKKRATMVAELGYVAFCADMYGDGAVTEHPMKAGEMAGMVRKNKDVWLGRANAAIETLQKQPQVDPKKIAIMGYCFGGTTSLMVALSGHADVKAAVSFHGALPAVTADDAKKVKAKVLVCHGADDSFIKDEAVAGFKKAFDDAKVHYEFESYPGAVHSFTVKGAEDRGIKGMAYNEEADKKSWASMQKVLKEAFAK
ncbi:dienelactone hydrolase family protein [Limnoglobus roseus]|uniref:Dienelactone hydrolase family protein n=1 Tax=Limnoglobus roseus TaxID=2598579 RepID=A0A5C1A229_9BACT|nr:dienelactone hydrolase family protein [Limnoglobus roseus]QEL13171.1 dienelactone hydrolase family protein [Limnoglobus roseus]